MLHSEAAYLDFYPEQSQPSLIWVEAKGVALQPRIFANSRKVLTEDPLLVRG